MFSYGFYRVLVLACDSTTDFFFFMASEQCLFTQQTFKNYFCASILRREGSKDK